MSNDKLFFKINKAGQDFKKIYEMAEKIKADLKDDIKPIDPAIFALIDFSIHKIGQECYRATDRLGILLGKYCGDD